MYQNIIKVLEFINRDLASLKEDADQDSFNKVRNLVIHFSHLEYAEMNIFAALKSPKDDIFYQQEDSESWMKLREIIVDVRATGDEERYAN